MFELPIFVTDRPDPYRPRAALWLDEFSGLLVGEELATPEEAEGAVGRALKAALEHPKPGFPRKPDRVRVADPALVAELTQVLGDGTPIDVAPTPELNEVVESLLGYFATQDEGDGEPESYLEGGRVAPAVVGDLFRAAAKLHGVAPWQVVDEDQPLHMDIPSLGVRGACVCIIGRLGKSRGVLVFSSLADYDAFAEAREDPADDVSFDAFGFDDLGADLGAGWLALDLERGADLPELMRREVATHRWPVAHARAYPRVRCVERDGVLRPLVERDVKIATACAWALAEFVPRNRAAFAGDEFEPVSATCTNDAGLDVCLTIPYEAFGEFLENTPPPPPGASGARSKVGRNDPCPCGSGRKYKKCHLPEDAAARASPSGPPRYHELDGWTVRELSRYASARLGEAWFGFLDDFVDPSDAVQLAAPWSVYHYRVDDQSVLERYLHERGARLSPAERGWLEAQRRVWLSVWEVLAVEPGEGLTLQDQLSGETRHVREATASRALVVRDALLARVVDHEGTSLLCGVHPSALPPLEAAEVVRRCRGRLRRKRAVPPERLRDEAFGRYLIRRWEEAADELGELAEIPRELRNRDGDPLLFTTDHFAIAPAARDQVEARLVELGGRRAEDAVDEAAVDEGGVPAAEYHFVSGAAAGEALLGPSLLGVARLAGDSLRLETNSRERADALRARLEAACAGLLRHRAREHADPLSEAADAAGEPHELPASEADQLLLDFKRRHYADWSDQPLPALGGRTPRDAVQTAEGRREVDTLLKFMQNLEVRSGSDGAFDFATLRRELGLE